MTSQDTWLPPEAIAAADRGDTIEAVKITREATGSSLADAKNAVDTYLRTGGAARAGADPSRGAGFEEPRRGATGDGARGNDIPPEAIAALHQGKLIDAIKKTREKTGLGLKEAKEAVDLHLARNDGTNQRFRAAAADDRRGFVQVLKLAILAALVTLAYFWLSGRLD